MSQPCCYCRRDDQPPPAHYQPADEDPRLPLSQSLPKKGVRGHGRKPVSEPVHQQPLQPSASRGEPQRRADRTPPSIDYIEPDHRLMEVGAVTGVRVTPTNLSLMSGYSSTLTNFSTLELRPAVRKSNRRG